MDLAGPERGERIAAENLDLFGRRYGGAAYNWQPSGFMRLPGELIDFPHPIVLLPAVEYFSAEPAMAVTTTPASRLKDQPWIRKAANSAFSA
jgi:hypothetical protein